MSTYCSYETRRVFMKHTNSAFLFTAFHSKFSGFYKELPTLFRHQHECNKNSIAVGSVAVKQRGIEESHNLWKWNSVSQFIENCKLNPFIVIWLLFKLWKREFSNKLKQALATTDPTQWLALCEIKWSTFSGWIFTSAQYFVLLSHQTRSEVMATQIEIAGNQM